MSENITMPAEEEIYYLSEFYKVFGDSTRIKVLYLLVNRELCVNDIANELAMTPSSISHQLRVLKQHRLVKFRRDGKTVYYSLADEHVETILNQGLEHIEDKNTDRTGRFLTGSICSSLFVRMFDQTEICVKCVQHECLHSQILHPLFISVGFPDLFPADLF